MPNYLVANIWPFIINCPLWATQIYLVVYGQNITYSQRLIPGFSILSVCMLIIPFLCNIGGTTAFFSTDFMLLICGVASGLVQGSTF